MNINSSNAVKLTQTTVPNMTSPNSGSVNITSGKISPKTNLKANVKTPGFLRRIMLLIQQIIHKIIPFHPDISKVLSNRGEAIDLLQKYFVKNPGSFLVIPPKGKDKVHSILFVGANHYVQERLTTEPDSVRDIVENELSLSKKDKRRSFNILQVSTEYLIFPALQEMAEKTHNLAKFFQTAKPGDYCVEKDKGSYKIHFFNRSKQRKSFFLHQESLGSVYADLYESPQDPIPSKSYLIKNPEGILNIVKENLQTIPKAKTQENTANMNNKEGDCADKKVEKMPDKNLFKQIPVLTPQDPIGAYVRDGSMLRFVSSGKIIRLHPIWDEDNTKYSEEEIAQLVKTLILDDVTVKQVVDENLENKDLFIGSYCLKDRVIRYIDLDGKVKSYSMSSEEANKAPEKTLESMFEKQLVPQRKK